MTVTTRKGGRRTALWTLAFGLLCLAPLEASAAGYYLPMRGVRPAGRAGAVVVSGGGPHALWYNPAQMLALEGTHLLLDAGVVNLSNSYLRTPRQQPNGDILVYDAVSNSNAPAVVPNLIAITDFGLERFRFGLGLLAPYGSLVTYPTEGAQRYVLIQNANSAPFQVGLGVAYQVTDWFRVGIGFQNLFLFSETTATASAYQGLFGQPEDQDLDIRLRITATDLFTPMGNLGLWFQLAEGLELGLTAQLGGSPTDGHAKLEIRLPTNPFFDNAQVNGDTVSAGLDLAPSVRAGLRWVHSRGDVELDVTWEGWSVHDQIRADPGVLVLTGVFGVDEFEVGSLNIPMGWQDTWGISLGSDFVILPDRLTARAGLVWEQGAIPDRRFSVFQWDVDKIAPSLGLTVDFPDAHLRLDAAYSHFFMTDKHISTSLVEQINPTFQQGAVIVGNGDYSASVDLFGLGLEATF